MNWRRIIPGFLKPVLRPMYDVAHRVYQRLTYRPKRREELHEHWKKPTDQGNLPENYLQGSVRSAYLVELVERFIGGVGREARILELGCNVGRNLDHLFRAGFKDLTGIEINPEALEILRKRFPELSGIAKIEIGSIEERIKAYDDGRFDVVFTMAVLEHLHFESEWVFAEMARVTKHLLVTIEDERSLSDRHFPRRYDRIFTGLGLKQVEFQECVKLEGLGPGFFARVFQKA